VARLLGPRLSYSDRTMLFTEYVQAAASVLSKPVIANTHLDSVELLIPNSQIGVGNVRPPAANVHRLVRFCKNLNPAAAPRGEVEVRRISHGEVGVSSHRASCQFDVGCDTIGMQAGIPPQNDGFKPSAVNRLWAKLPKYRNNGESVFEAATPPAAADFARQHLTHEDSSRQNLGFGKRVGVLFTGLPSYPDTEVPSARGRLRGLGLRIASMDEK